MMIRNASDIRRTADELRSPFFSPSAMRFFNSRLLNTFRPLNDDGTRGLFITSDRFDSDTLREYSVRLYQFDMSSTYPFQVDTLECFTTREQADKFVCNYSETA